MPADPVRIRLAEQRDGDAIAEILSAVIATGESFAAEPGTAAEAALADWTAPPAAVFVAEAEGRVVGTYLIDPNQEGLGSHVAHGSFAVSPDARGLGVGRAMGEHAIAEARERGYRAMQFNLVVATNEGAVALWRSLGLRDRRPAAGRVSSSAGALRGRSRDVPRTLSPRPAMPDPGWELASRRPSGPVLSMPRPGCAAKHPQPPSACIGGGPRLPRSVPARLAAPRARGGGGLAFRLLPDRRRAGRRQDPPRPDPRPRSCCAEGEIDRVAIVCPTAPLTQQWAIARRRARPQPRSPTRRTCGRPGTSRASRSPMRASPPPRPHTRGNAPSGRS